MAAFALSSTFAANATAQEAAPVGAPGAVGLEARLLAEPREALAAAARAQGDGRRGAALFFQPQLGCARCHSIGSDAPASGVVPGGAPLGPDLLQLRDPPEPVSDVQLVEALLEPSKRIRPGFAPAPIDGVVSKLSPMPAGLVAALASRQQFLDLVRFLIELRDGGAARAKDLLPPPAQRRVALPDYEGRVDHAALLQALDGAAFERGAAIYQRVCANCHGTREQEGSLPAAPRFATATLKNGSDPLALYRTLTHGFGAMAPQGWMVPRQKYDVIHFLREAYLRDAPGGKSEIDAAYLAALPEGDTLGPEPSAFEPWSAMDYGSSFSHTIEVPGGAGAAPRSDGLAPRNLAGKGFVVRLDPGSGGVARGSQWLLYDLDTLRVAAAWSAPTDGASDAPRFLDWRGIQLNGEHAIHPRLVGRLAFANGDGPGVAQPGSGSFVDDARVLGRDGRRYGPLPREWARLRGIHRRGAQRVLESTVGATRVLELPAADGGDPTAPRFVRHFEIGPRREPLLLQVAQLGPDAIATPLAGAPARVRFGPPASEPPGAASSADARAGAATPLRFDGATWLERPLADAGAALDFAGGDFTLAARLRTRSDGPLVARAAAGPRWTPDGQVLFVRDGRLCFDIGWVGCVTAPRGIDDGEWHEVAMTWRRADGQVELWIDGVRDAVGGLRPRATLPEARLRIGFGAPDFPFERPFAGELAAVRIEGARPDSAPRPANERTAATRLLLELGAATEADVVERGFTVQRGAAAGAASAALPALIAGFEPPTAPLSFVVVDGALRLRVEAGPEPLRFALACEAERSGASSAPLPAPLDLGALLRDVGASAPEVVTTRWQRGGDAGGPFAIDTVVLPDANPWLAQLRPSGLDFLPDGRLALCTWDGDVWLLEFEGGGPGTGGAASASNAVGGTVRWRRFTSGLFQPLGLKVVDGLIHLTCRDALVVLHDHDGDDECDFVEWRNSDHQVTDHFHEFAMGLELDGDGNFLYAKSGRHALDALVPQHGTVLRVARDGSRTDVLARGLRAANGIGVLQDGALVVTDQEGFWTPKNRLNWIAPLDAGGPRFYGNLFAWHDGVSASDDAMEPPLCWLTNDFDRSPAEALVVQSRAWGALDDALLYSSYGEGRLFLVLHEPVPAGGRGARQGGAIALPGAAFPTGVMRGRFDSAGDLWCCGLFAWAGDATQPGGLYRVRRTVAPLRLPIALAATATGLRLTFAEPLERTSVVPAAFSGKVWSLKRSAHYGSAHHDERPLKPDGARLAADGRTVEIAFADFAPTWCYELRWSLRGADGGAVDGVLDGTLHALPPPR
ncbi:MAG: c-type cytochrome [Planctomycetes bacterium]|nr:c-type cytochrome [Planctomycetota bacterium]